MDRIISLGLALFSVLYMMASWRLPRFQMTTVIDAWVFPLGIGAVMFFLSVALWLQGNRHGPEVPARIRPALYLTATLVAYGLLMEPVGYVVSTTAFLILASAILGWRKWLSGSGVAVSFAVASYLLFDRFLAVPLPHGILPF